MAHAEQVVDVDKRYARMVALKAQLGDPQPDGLVISLVNPWSPNAYLDDQQRNGELGTRVLSTNPDDYKWETPKQNSAREDPAQDEELMEELQRRARARTEEPPSLFQMISRDTAVQFGIEQRWDADWNEAQAELYGPSKEDK